MFNFLRYRLLCGVFAASLLGVVIWGLYFGGGFDYSVDFTGGSQVLLRFSQAVSPESIKTLLKDAGYTGVDTREFSNSEICVRIADFSADNIGIGEKIKNEVQDKLKDTGNSVELLFTDSVGPGVGEYLRWSSIKAVLIALLLMLFYIALRFKFAFAVGAVVALFHDVLVIAAYFLLTKMEISVDIVGAILMTLGYSINDTIVIFTKIRENLVKIKDKSVEEIINLSISQTIRRTILTSASTALVVGSLIAFGGESLRGLSITLMLGIVFGTYSSVFIASPVMLMFYRRKKAE